MANAAITIDLNAKIANFETELKRATGSLDRFEKKGTQAAAVFKSAMGGLVGAVSVGAIAAFAKSSIDAADALNDMSQRTGVAVKTLAEYKLAATLADTSLDDLAKGIQKLTLSQGQAEQGGKAQAEALQRLGISAKDPKIAFEQLADAVANSTNPTRLAADLNAVLGRSYVNLLPLLQGGAQGLRDSADASASFAEAMVKLAPEAAKLNDQLDLLKMNAAGASGELLAKLVPALNEVFERIGLVKDLLGAGGLFNTLIVTGGTDDIGEAMRRVRNEISLTQKAIDGERGRGKDTSGFEERLRGLNAQLQILIANRTKALLAPPQTETQRLIKADRAGSGAGSFRAPAAGSAAKTTTDPLAGLLGQTDIGKLAAFDKQVALLNARFDGGRKNTELYTQAMTKLVETTFSANFTEFNKQMAEQDETQRMVAEHLKATNDAIYAQQQEWSEAGAALTDEMRTPLENANIEFGRLQDLLDRGVISWETYARAVMKVQDAIEETPEKPDEMDSFAKKFAENAQDSFADFFKNFDKGTDGMLQKFGETIKGLIAEAVAADLAKYLFGDLVKGGSGGGVAGSLLSGIGSFFGFADGGVAAYGRPVALPRFAGGGISNSATIFGEAGPEAAVPLPDGRRIPVEMRGGGGHTIIVNVNGSNNAPDVRRAAGQGAREALGMLSGAQRYA